MKQLLSKLQYLNYEKGEFVDAELRTFEATVRLIMSYPWPQDADMMSIGLTGPSVTIEDGAGSYLKIGCYYHGKFQLYLYTRAGRYFVRITDTMEEVLRIVSYYFDGVDIKQYFSPEPKLFIKQHFATGLFIYKVTLRRLLRVMMIPIIFGVPFLLICLISMDTGEGIAAIVVPCIWLFFFGINWLLFLNYFIHDVKRSLIVSVNKDEFSFGTKNNMRVYNKQDIQDFYVYASDSHHTRRRDPPWGLFEVYKLVMKDGTVIKFTSLIINSFVIYNKFAGIPTTRIYRFIPFTGFRK